MGQCVAVWARYGARCGLDVGHDGPHRTPSVVTDFVWPDGFEEHSWAVVAMTAWPAESGPDEVERVWGPFGSEADAIAYMVRWWEEHPDVAHRVLSVHKIEPAG